MDGPRLTLCVNLLLCLWWQHMTSHARVDALVYCRVQQKQRKIFVLRQIPSEFDMHVREEHLQGEWG